MVGITKQIATKFAEKPKLRTRSAKVGWKNCIEKMSKNSERRENVYRGSVQNCDRSVVCFEVALVS